MSVVAPVPTPGVDRAATTADAPSGPAGTPEQQRADHAQREAARAFEAIFVRKMLASLEKSSKPGATGEAGGGPGGIYASMMVGALSDAVTANGGIGLADVIVRALQPAHTPKK